MPREFNRTPQIGVQLRRNTSTVVRKTLLGVQARAKQKARVDTGFMRDNIILEPESLGPLDTYGEVIAAADYSVHNEYGTVHMSAQPFMTPAGEEERPGFEAALAKIGRGVR